MKNRPLILSEFLLSPRADEMAERATEYLFTNGAGESAKRLVLELENGKDGGGWCRNAVRDAIRRAIEGTL